MNLVLFFITLPFLIFALGLLLTNFHRQLIEYKFHLQPNCLLTRHPILFVYGKQSLFYFKRYWNAIPEYLKEHGYEIYEYKKPLFFSPKRGLKNYLKKLPQPIHIIGDISSLEELIELSQLDSKQIASLNIAITNRHSTYIPDPIHPVIIGYSQNKSAKGLFSWAQRIFFWSHNRLDPIETESQVLGVPYDRSIVQYKDYLNFAISLAEKDMQ